MNADIKGALAHINRSYRVFTNNGASMTKSEVKHVLTEGIKRGYTSTGDFKEGEVDEILKTMPPC